MQGPGRLGYFVIPYTLGDYIAGQSFPSVTTADDAFAEAEASAAARVTKLLTIRGNKTVTEFHRALGRLVWDYVGMARNRAGLERAITQIQDLREGSSGKT